MNNKIAVWIQAYNEEKYIAETIESILNQSYENIDLIISNNFSTDSTKSIIEKYIFKDSRIILWQPEKFCKSLEHGRGIINKLNLLEYGSTISIGGHDLISENYIKSLKETYDKNPNAAIIVGSGAEIDEKNNIIRNWPPVIQLTGGHISSRPLTILMNLYYNLAAFGLWSKKSRAATKFRHDCMCSDHLYVAEASLHGDIIVNPNAVIYTRRTEGVGEHNTYFKKHINDVMSEATILADFEKQIEWICHINEKAYAGFPQATKNILLSGAVGIYFSMFGISTLNSVDGALGAWLNSPAGLAIASQMSSIGQAISTNSKNIHSS